jgi:hypothetical protein
MLSLAGDEDLMMIRLTPELGRHIPIIPENVGEIAARHIRFDFAPSPDSAWPRSRRRSSCRRHPSPARQSAPAPSCCGCLEEGRSPRRPAEDRFEPRPGLSDEPRRRAVAGNPKLRDGATGAADSVACWRRRPGRPTPIHRRTVQSNYVPDAIHLCFATPIRATYGIIIIHVSRR